MIVLNGILDYSISPIVLTKAENVIQL